MTANPDYFAVVAQVMSGGPAQPAPTRSDAAILDAALVLLGEYGERRLTIDDVASRARVARRTVFRRFGSKDALVTSVYQREVSRVIAQVTAAAEAAAGPVEALTAAYCQLAEVAANHPVIRRLARIEPEVLVELWRSGSPSGHDMVRTVLQQLLQRHGATAPQLAALEDVCELLSRLLFADELLAREPGNQQFRAQVVRRLVHEVFPAETTPG